MCGIWHNLPLALFECIPSCFVFWIFRMQKVDLEISCSDTSQGFSHCLHGNAEIISHTRPHDCFLLHPFQFIIRRCVVWVNDSIFKYVYPIRVPCSNLWQWLRRCGHKLEMRYITLVYISEEEGVIWAFDYSSHLYTDHCYLKLYCFGLRLRRNRWKFELSGGNRGVSDMWQM
jgi:hypothetical protein